MTGSALDNNFHLYTFLDFESLESARSLIYGFATDKIVESFLSSVTPVLDYSAQHYRG